MNRFGGFALLLVCLLLVGRASAAPRPWRVYTGVNTLFTIQFGPRYVWAATDGGLVAWERKTARARRVDINDGLPGVGVYAAQPDPTDANAVWLVLRGEAYGKNHLARVVLDGRSGAAVQSWPLPSGASVPLLDLQVSSPPPDLSVSDTQVRIGGYNATWTFARSSRIWTVTASTLAQTRAWQKRHERANFSGAIQCVLPLPVQGKEGLHFFLIGVNFGLIAGNASAGSPGSGPAATLTPVYLASPRAGEAFSVPFGWRVVGDTVAYDVVASRAQLLPGSLLSYTYARVTWQRSATLRVGWRQLARIPIAPDQLALVQTEAARETTRSLGLGALSSLSAAAFDKATGLLWLGGSGGLARYNVRTGRGGILARAPDEVRLGAYGGVRRFESKNGRPVFITVGTENQTSSPVEVRYSYDPARDAWNTDRPRLSPNDASNGMRWRKVWVPTSPRASDPERKLQGRIAAQKGDWDWLLWSGSTSGRTAGFPTPFTQPPARVNRKTGQVRFFRELFGYFTLAVAPYGDGASAWLVAAPLGQDTRLGPRVLFHYEATQDRLSRRDLPLAVTARLPYEDDNTRVTATANGVALVGVGESATLLRVERDGAIETITLPPGRTVRDLQAATDCFVVSLNPLAGKYAPPEFWQLGAAATGLQRIALPAAVRAIEPQTMLVLPNRLWLAGSGIAWLVLPANTIAR